MALVGGATVEARVFVDEQAVSVGGRFDETFVVGFVELGGAFVEGGGGGGFKRNILEKKNLKKKF